MSSQNARSPSTFQELMYSVVSHEVAHVMGFGSLWGATSTRANALVTNTMYEKAKVEKLDYVGHGGVMGFLEIGGQPGIFPRVERANEGGGVSASAVDNPSTPPNMQGAHWRAKNFPKELMTATVQPDAPLSILTLRSLTDLGYKINPAAADPYTITGGGVNLRERVRRRRRASNKVDHHQTFEDEIYIPAEYGEVDVHHD
jgi:hypothetical protein